MSTSLAGYVMDHFGGQFTFELLASVAACGLGFAWLMLPETCFEPIGPDNDPHALRRTVFLDGVRVPNPDGFVSQSRRFDWTFRPYRNPRAIRSSSASNRAMRANSLGVTPTCCTNLRSNRRRPRRPARPAMPGMRAPSDLRMISVATAEIPSRRGAARARRRRN